MYFVSKEPNVFAFNNDFNPLFSKMHIPNYRSLKYQFVYWFIRLKVKSVS